MLLYLSFGKHLQAIVSLSFLLTLNELPPFACYDNWDSDQKSSEFGLKASEFGLNFFALKRVGGPNVGATTP